MPGIVISHKTYEKLKEIASMLGRDESKTVEWLIERFYEVVVRK
ncbi:MAG: hypothetical protein QW521_03675 [Desulfurococcaceae archaeon]